MNKKYILNDEENREFLRNCTDNLLNFGHNFPSPKGSSYYLGDDGTPWKDRPRETWITSRMAHVYSIGTMLGHKGAKELAGQAINGLLTELHDDKNGGWYAGINADGTILPTKQCYAHAFVILAATSGVLAGIEGADRLLDIALETYDKFFWDEKIGLSVDTWNTEFTILDDYRGLNANMHSVEAFLAVFDACGDVKYADRAKKIIDRVICWAKDNNWRIPEHFSKNWDAELECNKEKKDDPFKPYGATPGHGIEWARLITQWAKATGTDDEKYIDAAINLYNTAVSDAWNADGAPGICYTTGWDGQPIVHDRMHWTLAEAINSSSVLYQVTGNERYKEDYSNFMDYLDNVVIDHKNGSWFHQLDSHNNLLETVWPGKSDIYHALQATLIPYNKEVGVSIAKAVKDGYI